MRIVSVILILVLSSPGLVAQVIPSQQNGFNAGLVIGGFQPGFAPFQVTIDPRTTTSFDVDIYGFGNAAYALFGQASGVQSPYVTPFGFGHLNPLAPDFFTILDGISQPGPTLVAGGGTVLQIPTLGIAERQYWGGFQALVASPASLNGYQLTAATDLTIDGPSGRTWYIRSNGSFQGQGTRADPVNTYRAIQRQVAPGDVVRFAAGTVDTIFRGLGSPELPQGVSWHGRWEDETSGRATIGTTTDGLLGLNLGSVTFSHIDFESQAGLLPGEQSVAVRIVGGQPRFVNCRFIAKNASDGSAGPDGAAGLDGCDAFDHRGAIGDRGLVGQPGPPRCGPTPFGNQPFSGAMGGAAFSDGFSLVYFGTTVQGGTGGTGTQNCIGTGYTGATRGQDGIAGTHGLPGPAAGAVTFSHWDGAANFVPRHGNDGGNGLPGSGGAGGGGGHDYRCLGNRRMPGRGGGGGGGGAGGQGGRGGRSGGPSVAVVVIDSNPIFDNCVFQTGNGGRGGSAGLGGAGGLGGQGHTGGNGAAPGGRGGAGGDGAQGAGGDGGSSVAIWLEGTSTPIFRGTTTYNLGTPGQGGTGLILPPDPNFPTLPPFNSTGRPGLSGNFNR